MKTFGTREYVIIAVVVILVVGGGLFAYHYTKPGSSSETSTTTSSGGLSVQTSGGAATIQEIPVSPTPASSAPAEPSLDKPLTFMGQGASLSAPAQAAITTQYNSVVATLKQDPTKLNYWLQLGIDRKIAGDYAGAAEAWLYVQAVAPKDEVSAADLADLYANFVKDYPKAETYYLKAIADDPHAIDDYVNLHTLYTYSYKVGTPAAHNILEQGLQANPGNQELQNLLDGKTP